VKRIVICFDGTWNKPADERLPADRQIETNVCRFYKSVTDTAADGIRQVKWYDEGIGTKWYDRFIGGSTGAGLEKNILDGYKFLAKEYRESDEVYILGFSRGAYTARSLAGLIRNCGLVKNKQLSLRMAMAYGIYRTRDDGPDSSTALDFRARFSREIKIKFLGVWDTVGALGIPLDILKRLNMYFYQFHDTRLSHIVENGYQAIAIDEHRMDYDICLWTPDASPQQNLEQRWFVGAHSDVGGGYPDRRLSDLTLRWIQDKAMAAGLGVTPIDVGADNYLGAITDSYAQFLNGVYAHTQQRHYRALGTARFGNEVIDDSAQRRRKKDRNYKPPNAGLPPLR
jgi:uncharacterized protein (DUF2235 family)